MMYSCYQVLALFCIYSFLGWCVEVAYAAVNSGKFVNRGFLNGPVCPIYGFGIVTVILTLEPLKNNLFILYIGSVIVTSLIELVTGFVLEKIFHDKWWDYSDDHFNIKGYICLKFSLLWGIACILVVDVVQPLIVDLVNLIPVNMGKILVTIFIVLFFVDFLVTLSNISKFKKKIRVLDELAGKIRKLSDEIGIDISDEVFMAMEGQETVKKDVNNIKKAVSSKVNVEKRRKELAELKEKYEEFTKKQKIGNERIFKAFPALQKGRYKKYIDKVKNRHKK